MHGVGGETDHRPCGKLGEPVEGVDVGDEGGVGGRVGGRTDGAGQFEVIGAGDTVGAEGAGTSGATCMAEIAVEVGEVGLEVVAGLAGTVPRDDLGVGRAGSTRESGLVAQRQEPLHLVGQHREHRQDEQHIIIY